MKSLPAHRPRPATPRAARGFTLIELMVTIAIAGVLAAVAAPSLTTTFRGNRVQGEAASLVSDMQIARTEAIKRGLTVTLCASTDQQTCSTTNAWQNGWIVFPDPTAAQTNSTNATPLRVRTVFKGTDTLVASPSTVAVSFNREGFTSNLGTGTVLFTLHTADNVGPLTRCVGVNIGGRITTVKKSQQVGSSTCS